MGTVGIGAHFRDRLKPAIVWCVVGILDTADGRFALLLSTDATCFCEVEVAALVDRERFIPIHEKG